MTDPYATAGLVSIQSDGTATGTTIMVDGTPIYNVRHVDIRIDSDTGLVSAVLTLDMVNLDLGVTLQRKDTWVSSISAASEYDIDAIWKAVASVPKRTPTI